jgi:hypothetical protein
MTKEPGALVWHYTPSYRARGILETGAILPGMSKTPRWAENLVWFSANPNHEPTATVHSPSVAAAVSDAFMVRFGVPLAITTPYRKLRLSPTVRRVLYKKGRARGAVPSDWYCIRGAVALSRVACIGWNRDGRWGAVTAETLLEHMAEWPVVLAA